MSALKPSADTPGQEPVVVSGTSPLADGFRSRFFSAADYRRFHARAPRYDAENGFFAEDFADLVAAGYLKAPLPDGSVVQGLSLTEIAREQRHLAYWAPATALAVNMHLYWAGSAADAAARGVVDVEWLLGDIAAGKVFAAGHGERGNDVGLDDAQVRAVPQARWLLPHHRTQGVHLSVAGVGPDRHPRPRRLGPRTIPSSCTRSSAATIPVCASRRPGTR